MNIQQEIEEILPRVLEIRHYIHTHPELSLQERKTAAFVRKQLSALDLELETPYLETDVVVILNGKNPGKNITLRADMDALPIVEASNLPYKSINQGVMHACGHDGHTAMLLGAAMVLSKLKSQLSGSVRFVFQPGEEIVAAAKDLVAAGALRTPAPSMVLAMHGWPGLPVGTISSLPGPMMAAADFFKITIIGRGSHGSRPDLAIDPILIANQVLNKIYLLASRKVRALDSIVVSICSISGGSNSNTIPDEVEMEGTSRYFDRALGKEIPLMFEDILKHECKLAGADYKLDYRSPYLPVVNDPDVVSFCKQNVEEVLGEDMWTDLSESVMVSEDFCYYIQDNPGAMFFLGMGEDSPGLHMAGYNFNDEALKNGIHFFVSSSLKLLESSYL